LSLLHRDLLLHWVLRILALLASLIVGLIAIFLIVESFPVLNHMGLFAFFSDASWHPTEQLFNLLPMLWASLMVVGGALILSIPLSILSALFCEFYAPARLAILYRRIIELLAGIPSVIYGFWGLVVLVPIIASIEAPGTSLLAGILVLSFMILPTLTLFGITAFRHISQQQIASSMALGISKAGFICHVILPLARPALLAGTLLQTGRAVGETMALLMVCGNVVQTPSHLFEPMRTLTSNIALEMAYAMDDHRSALFVSGLILLLIIIGLVILSNLLVKKPNNGDTV